MYFVFLFVWVAFYVLYINSGFWFFSNISFPFPLIDDWMRRKYLQQVIHPPISIPPEPSPRPMYLTLRQLYLLYYSFPYTPCFETRSVFQFPRLFRFSLPRGGAPFEGGSSFSFQFNFHCYSASLSAFPPDLWLFLFQIDSVAHLIIPASSNYLVSTKEKIS